MISWVKLLLWVVMNIPTLVKLVKFIIDLINGIEDKRERRAASVELAAAVKRAKACGNDAELRNLMLKLSRRSAG